MSDQQRIITLQMTEEQYEHIKYCVDYVKRNREMALKAYYDKKEKKGDKSRHQKIDINLPNVQDVNIQQPIRATTNHVEKAILPIKPPSPTMQLVIMKQPIQIAV